jgi:hypothetical protein
LDDSALDGPPRLRPHLFVKGADSDGGLTAGPQTLRRAPPAVREVGRRSPRGGQETVDAGHLGDPPQAFGGGDDRDLDVPLAGVVLDV